MSALYEIDLIASVAVKKNLYIVPQNAVAQVSSKNILVKEKGKTFCGWHQN